MDIFIKQSKKAILFEQDCIFLKDIAEIIVTKHDEPSVMVKKIGLIKLLKTGEEKKAYLISILDIMQAIEKAMPGNTISSVGEMDTVVEYAPKKPKQNAMLRWGKILFVATVLFVGSATAIMSFHSDGQMPQIFISYYKIFFGEKIDKPYILYVPYSIGLMVGIIVFFNHFAGVKLTNDPTPIEVQMALYENDVTTTLIDALNAEREQNGDVEKQKGKGG